MATAPGTVLLVVLGLSLAAHVGLAVYTLDQPMGYVDPAALRGPASPIRIKRARFDQYVQPGQALDDQAEEDDAPTAAQASAALLEQSSAPLPEPEFQPRPELRSADDQPAPETDDSLLGDADGFELPADALAAMQGQAPEELAYQPAPGSGPGNGDGSGAGGGDGPGGAGSAQARELLRSTGIVTGADAPPDPVGDLGSRDRQDTEQALIDAPLTGPPIDFAGVALDQTTQLDVPEHLDNDFKYTLTRYDGPADQPGQPGYFRVDITARRSLRKLHAMPKDVIFLLDTSSSVPEPWVKAAAEGIRQALPSLNTDDRFNLVFFNQNPRALSTEKLQPVNEQTLGQARAFLGGAASRGFTDVNAALRQMLVRDVDTQRAYEIILISDGLPTRGVRDTRDLINLITRDNDLAASIYCVGVGPKQNGVLLNFLAYRNKGFSTFAHSPGQAVARIRDLMSRLRYPLISNVSVGAAGVDSGAVYPKYLPNIHQGETFSVYGRFDAPGPFTMRITGLSDGQPVDFTFTRNLIEAGLGDQALSRQWAFWKLHSLYSEMLRATADQRGRLRDQIDQIQEDYGLQTVY